jgi:outer membrane protein assembly factor BamE
MISQVKEGMTREQVRFLLGTPLLTDIFHADRWDYVYWREAPNGKRESRKLALFFSDNKLVRADGDMIPDKLPGAPAPQSTQISPVPPAQSAVQPAPEGPAAAPISVQPAPPAPTPAPLPTPAPTQAPSPTQAPPAPEAR